MTGLDQSADELLAKEEMKDNALLMGYAIRMEHIQDMIDYYEKAKDETLEKIQAINVKRMTRNALTNG